MKYFNFLEVGFNMDAAKSLVLKFATPFNSFLLWTMPLVFGLYVLIKAFQFYTTSEDERRNEKFSTSIKKGFIIFIFVESFSAILKIIGI